MPDLPLLGPHDAPVPPLPAHRNLYRTGTSGAYTVTLPPLATVNRGDHIAVQRYTRDTGTAPVTVTTSPGDTLSDDATTFTLNHPGDLFLLESSSTSGVRSWLVVDMQVTPASGSGVSFTDNGDGGATLS